MEEQQTHRWKIIYLRGDLDNFYENHPEIVSPEGVGMIYMYSKRTTIIEATTKEEALAILRDACGMSVQVAPLLVGRLEYLQAANIKSDDLLVLGENRTCTKFLGLPFVLGTAIRSDA